MFQVNIHEAKTHLSKLISRVLNGEEIVIAKGNKPVAKLIQFTDLKQERKIGSAKGKIEVSDDFDEAMDDMKEYMN